MRKTSSLLALLAIAFVTVLAPIAWADEVQGKIKSFDAAGNTVVLEDGTQLMIPPTVRVERQALITPPERRALPVVRLPLQNPPARISRLPRISDSARGTARGRFGRALRSARSIHS
ncbi:MAG: hypothetical protein DME07_19035 [Candidatus Rokuibacteriota bacterium]|nr:MAG: hypothetical protein DME07_19035 [Candidatus Rokubacteria bacterium]